MLSAVEHWSSRSPSMPSSAERHDILDWMRVRGFDAAMVDYRKENGMRARGACDWTAATSNHSTLPALLPQLDLTREPLEDTTTWDGKRWTREHSVSPGHHVIRYADRIA